MARILVHEFTTLDGSVGTPTWTFDHPFDPRMGPAIGGLMGSCRGLLLGRRTYEMFAPVWSTRTAEDDPGAPFMNESPKYVVSSSLEQGEWNNTHLIGGYSAETVQKLKDDLDGDLYVSGSATLVRALLADGLVDQLHLFVFPLALGEGPRLFGDGQRLALSLLDSQAYDNGVLYLTYAPAV